MAAIQDITINQGETTVINFTVKKLTLENSPYDPITNPYEPINITLTKIRMEGRVSVDSPAPTFNWSDNVNTVGGTGNFVIVDGSGGAFQLRLSAVDTTKIYFKGSQLDLLYDIELEDDIGSVIRAFEGTLTIIREITR